MNKIDAHQHFWKFDPIRDSWIDESMQKIRRDFLPQDFAPILQQHGFGGCVAVQSDQSEEENVFHLNLADQHDFIKGIVGWVDLRASEIEERLAFYSQFKKMKGFRHVLQGEPVRDLMLQPDFMRGIGLLNKYGFTYDILIFTDQLPFAETFVASFPDQPFVVDHIAKPNIKEQSVEVWKRGIEQVAQHQNVFCKISGMVTEADWNGWKKEDFRPYLDVVVDAFGIRRIMYGSDWPVCLVAAPYADMLGIVEDYFSQFSADEQDQFFRRNATRFYNLKN